MSDPVTDSAARIVGLNASSPRYEREIQKELLRFMVAIGACDPLLMKLPGGRQLCSYKDGSGVYCCRLVSLKRKHAWCVEHSGS